MKFASLPPPGRMRRHPPSSQQANAAIVSQQVGALKCARTNRCSSDRLGLGLVELHGIGVCHALARAGSGLFAPAGLSRPEEAVVDSGGSADLPKADSGDRHQWVDNSHLSANVADRPAALLLQLDRSG